MKNIKCIDANQVIFNNSKPTKKDFDRLRNAKGKKEMLNALDKFRLPKALTRNNDDNYTDNAKGILWQI